MTWFGERTCVGCVVRVNPWVFLQEVNYEEPPTTGPSFGTGQFVFGHDRLATLLSHTRIAEWIFLRTLTCGLRRAGDGCCSIGLWYMPCLASGLKVLFNVPSGTLEPSKTCQAEHALNM